MLPSRFSHILAKLPQIRPWTRTAFQKNPREVGRQNFDAGPADHRRYLCRRSLHPPFNSSSTLTRQDSQPYRPDVPSFHPFHDSKLTVQPTTGKKERDGNACFTPLTRWTRSEQAWFAILSLRVSPLHNSHENPPKTPQEPSASRKRFQAHFSPQNQKTGQNKPRTRTPLSRGVEGGVVPRIVRHKRSLRRDKPSQGTPLARPSRSEEPVPTR